MQNMYIKLDVKFIPNIIRLLSFYYCHKLLGAFCFYLKKKLLNYVFIKFIATIRSSFCRFLIMWTAEEAKPFFNDPFRSDDENYAGMCVFADVDFCFVLHKEDDCVNRVLSIQCE